MEPIHLGVALAYTLLWLSLGGTPRAASWVALGHNTVIAVCVLYWYQQALPLTGGWLWLLVAARGYFLWDLAAALAGPSLDMVIHALLCYTAYTVAAEGFLAYEATCLLLYECSTPFLHVVHLTTRDNPWHHRAKVVFALTFWGVRNVWGLHFSLTRVLPPVWAARHTAAFLCLLLSVMLNLHWGVRIARIAWQSYRNKGAHRRA